MMETKAIIKQRIQQHMAAKGVTLTELAERIPGKNGQGHMSKGSLSAMINEGNFTLKSLEKIAEALGVTVAEQVHRGLDVPDLLSMGKNRRSQQGCCGEQTFLHGIIL